MNQVERLRDAMIAKHDGCMAMLQRLLNRDENKLSCALVAPIISCDCFRKGFLGEDMAGSIPPRVEGESSTPLEWVLFVEGAQQERPKRFVGRADGECMDADWTSGQSLHHAHLSGTNLAFYAEDFGLGLETRCRSTSEKAIVRLERGTGQAWLAPAEQAEKGAGPLRRLFLWLSVSFTGEDSGEVPVALLISTFDEKRMGNVMRVGREVGCVQSGGNSRRLACSERWCGGVWEVAEVTYTHELYRCASLCYATPW